jgi:hypothetical protein
MEGGRDEIEEENKQIDKFLRLRRERGISCHCSGKSQCQVKRI